MKRGSDFENVPQPRPLRTSAVISERLLGRVQDGGSRSVSMVLSVVPSGCGSRWF